MLAFFFSNSLLRQRLAIHTNTLNTHSPEEFMGLTDAILSEARNSADPALARAAALVRRLERRDLYAFCAEVRRLI